MTSVPRRRRLSSQSRWMEAAGADRLPRHAALAAQHDAAAVGFQHAAHQRFIRAEAVKRCRVEERDARVQRLQQQRLGRRGLGRRAVGVAEVHAAQADLGHLEGADAARLHAAASCCSSRCSTS
jgi:hypothetical protein